MGSIKITLKVLLIAVIFCEIGIVAADANLHSFRVRTDELFVDYIGGNSTSDRVNITGLVVQAGQILGYYNESSVDDQINMCMANLSAVNSTLYTEISSRQSADASLQINISSVNSSLNAHMDDAGNPHNITASQIGAAAEIHGHDIKVSNVSGLSGILDNKYNKSETDTLLGTKVNVLDLTTHTGNTSNPHSVTAGQVGAASSSDLSSVNSSLNAHKSDNTSNPHSVTATQLGADNILTQVNSATGTISDDRLPSTMAGKTFSSAITVNGVSGLADADVPNTITINQASNADTVSNYPATTAASATTGVPVISSSTTYTNLKAGYASTAGDADTLNGSNLSDIGKLKKLTWSASTERSCTVYDDYCTLYTYSNAITIPANSILLTVKATWEDKLSIAGAGSKDSQVQILGWTTLTSGGPIDSSDYVSVGWRKVTSLKENWDATSYSIKLYGGHNFLSSQTVYMKNVEIEILYLEL